MEGGGGGARGTGGAGLRRLPSALLERSQGHPPGSGVGRNRSRSGEARERGALGRQRAQLLQRDALHDDADGLGRDAALVHAQLLEQVGLELRQR